MLVNAKTNENTSVVRLDQIGLSMVFIQIGKIDKKKFKKKGDLQLKIFIRKKIFEFHKIFCMRIK